MAPLLDRPVLNTEREMEKTWASNVLSLLIAIFVLLQFVQLLLPSPEFIRPPPRGIIFTPHNRSGSEPQQVHISLVGRDHMRISWMTAERHAPSIVEYGKTPGKYEALATGEHTSYHYLFYISGKIHHVTIGPLDPNTYYYYRCGGTGQEFSFKTPPSTFPIEFAVAGDLGQTEWTASTLKHINNSNYDVLLLPGDLSYADGQQTLRHLRMPCGAICEQSSMDDHRGQP
uniref:Purple acid phosphatase N-terminal domain-containing protein n=1 Tax=Nelumbo nucifera TaxID=4432 RepID=A0A822ZUM4_NELNU|nr:TPA_asm: hypothetical protein HUJ06_018524 [Nelumbo nucifera]